MAGPREPQKQKASNGDASSASLVDPRGGRCRSEISSGSGKRTSGNMGRGFRREGASGRSWRERRRETVDLVQQCRYPVPCRACGRCARPGTGDMARRATSTCPAGRAAASACTCTGTSNTAQYLCNALQPAPARSSQPACGWGHPSGSQWSAADSMDPRRFFAGQIPLLRRMRPIALRLDCARGYAVHSAATLHKQCFQCILCGDKYSGLAEPASGSRPGSLSPGGSLSRPVLGTLAAWRLRRTGTLYPWSELD